LLSSFVLFRILLTFVSLFSFSVSSKATTCVDLVRNSTNPTLGLLTKDGLRALPGKRVEKPYLWSIKKDGEVRGYFFGTMHSDIKLSSLPASILEKIRDSGITVKESPYGDRVPPELDKARTNQFWRQLEGRAALLPEIPKVDYEKVKHLRELLMADMHAFKNQLIATEGYSRFDFDHFARNISYMFRPAGNEASVFYAQDRLFHIAFSPWLTFPEQNQLDTRLANYALENGVQTDFLETSYDQIYTVAQSYTLDDLLNWIREMREKSGNLFWSIRLETEREILRYYTGDFEGMNAVVDSYTDYQYEMFLGLRNRNWMPKILDLLEHPRNGKPSFILVGNYHFAGKDSLLTLTQNAGFTVSREF